MVTASKQTASTTADIKSQFIIFPDWSIGQAGKINHDIFCVFGAHCNCEEYSVGPGPVGNHRREGKGTGTSRGNCEGEGTG